MQQVRHPPNSDATSAISSYASAVVRKRRGLSAAVAVIREAVLGAPSTPKAGSAAEARRRLALETGRPQERLREILERDRALRTAPTTNATNATNNQSTPTALSPSLASARLSAFGVLSPSPARMRLRPEGWTAVPAEAAAPRAEEITANGLPSPALLAASALPHELSSMPTSIGSSATPAREAVVAPAADRLTETTEPHRSETASQRADTGAEEPCAASPATETDEDEEELPVPIRTRTMARLLVAQGKLDQALAIFDELLAADAGQDLGLAQEAAQLRQRIASTHH